MFALHLRSIIYPYLDMHKLRLLSCHRPSKQLKTQGRAASFLNRDPQVADFAMRPKSAAFGRRSNPVCSAGWSPEDALSRDQMPDIISLHWFTNAAASSARICWENRDASFSGGKRSLTPQPSSRERDIVLQTAGPSRPIPISSTGTRPSITAISPLSRSRTFLWKKCVPRCEN